jgi:hypothetical protein
MFRRIFGALICIIIVAFVGYEAAISAFRNKLFDLYVHRLDTWVKSGGNQNTIQTVVNNCGRLILSQAGWFERLQLMTVDRDEFDFRVDVCTKLTVNRIYKQPEFEKPDIVRMICWDPHPYHRVFYAYVSMMACGRPIEVFILEPEP